MMYFMILFWIYEKRDKEFFDVNTQPKPTKKIRLAVVLLLIAIAALSCVYRLTRQNGDAGAKTVTIKVIHKDASQNTFICHTDREYLGELLTDESIADGENGPYGLFITTVDGETADETAQEWWCITQNQEMLNTSADQTPLADGDQYELTLTTGY